MRFLIVKAWGKPGWGVAPGKRRFSCRALSPYDVEKVPDAPLLEDLIGLKEEEGGDRETHGLRGFEVDDEPKARRLLERQVGRLGPFENAIDERGHPAEAFVQIRAIRHQAAVPHEVVDLIDGRELLGGGERKYPLAVEQGERVSDHQDGVRPLALHRRKGLLEIVGLAHAERLAAEAPRPRARLRRPGPARRARGAS